MTRLAHNLTEMSALAREVLSSLSPAANQATILALSGELGSGKTTFTQFLAQELGVKDYVTSPTFVIEKKYRCAAGQPFKQLVHLDCYRLNQSEEMLQLDWQEIVGDPNNLIIVEWPERISELLPPGAKKLEFKFVDENTRAVTVFD